LAQASGPGFPLPDESVDTTLKRLFGNRTFQRGDDKIKLELPQIAEDGGNVAITVDSSLPVNGAASVSLKAAQDLSLEAGGDIKIKAGLNATVEAGAKAVVKGNFQASLEGAAAAQVQGATVTVKGMTSFSP